MYVGRGDGEMTIILDEERGDERFIIYSQCT